MEDIFVGRLMSTPVTTVSPDAPAQRAATLMIEEGVGSLVVVEGDDPAGILTTTDFVDIVAHGTSEESTVGEHMSTNLTTTTVNESIASVAETIVDADVHHLPVVDDSTGVVGMVTTTDLTAYLSGIAPQAGRKDVPNIS
jgi:CBS domain-containing protein